MRWYQALKVLLVIRIVFSVSSIIYLIYLTGSEFFGLLQYAPEYALVLLALLGFIVIDILLFRSLLRYSEHAPDFCIAMLAFSAIVYVLITILFSFGIVDGLGFLLGQFILYLPSYFYLRKRLVKAYWADQSKLTPDKAKQALTVEPNNKTDLS
jgi:hypothetical protein